MRRVGVPSCSKPVILTRVSGIIARRAAMLERRRSPVSLRGLPGVTITRAGRAAVAPRLCGYEHVAIVGWVERSPNNPMRKPGRRAASCIPSRKKPARSGAIFKTCAVGHAGLAWPEPHDVPELVSCSTPTDHVCILPVAIPIAPKPNSPPSANWVEALCRTMASRRDQKRCAVSALPVTMASVCWEP